MHLKFFIFFIIFCGLSLFLTAGLVLAENIVWTETQAAGSINQNWSTVASSSDGSRLIAGVYGGRLYISSDSGVTWIETRPAGNSNKNWNTVASNSDGSRLIAGVYGARLYISSDSGVTWIETRPAGNSNKNWYAVASNSDGSRLIAGVYGGRLYTFNASAGVWIEAKPAGNANKNWRVVASNSDGSRLIAGVYGARLYISSDFGVTWIETRPAGNSNKNWNALASDSTGAHLLVGNKGGRLYASFDGGNNWIETRPAGNSNKNWNALASDSTGANLIAGVYGGWLYTSSDSGITWAERWPVGAVDKNWSTVASNSDGSHLIAGVYGGRLYTGLSSLENSNNEPIVSSVAGNFSLNKIARVIGAGFSSIKGSVMITNASTMGASSVKVTQSVSQWSDELIFFAVKPGSFANGANVYLYVKKSTGEYNTTGFPIVIGEGHADATAPVITSSYPAANDVRIPIGTKITVELSDPDPGINDASIAFYVNNSKVLPTISKSGQSIILEYLPPVAFNYFQTVGIKVVASDLDGNKLDWSYSFKTLTAVAYSNIAWDLEKLTPSYAISDVDSSDTVRILIEGKYLAFSANKIALEFIGRKTGDYRIKNVSIAEADPLPGQEKVVAGTWTKVLFDKQTNSNWQNSYITVLAGGIKVSNFLDFVIDPAKSYYVTFSNETKGVTEIAYSESIAFHYPLATSSPRATQDYSLTQDLTGGSVGSFLNLSRIYAANVINTRYKLFISAVNGSVGTSQGGPYYNSGAQLTLTASANSGYIFDHWSGDITGTINPATIMMDSDKTVIANFSTTGPVIVGTTYTLTITPSNGTTLGSSFSSVYGAGAAVTLSAIPTAGYSFDHWSGDVTGNINPINITMDGNKSVIGNFTPVSPSSMIKLVNTTGAFLSGALNFLKQLFTFNF